jgi:indolepyruvate ferredoxin oxidoreductase alpha subunit
VTGCGIDHLAVVDPYDIPAMRKALKRAAEYVEAPDGGIAVIIARHPCVIAYRSEAIPAKHRVVVTDDCDNCGFCHQRFECPAMFHSPELDRTEIDRRLCVDCGLCIQICPKHAIVEG